MSQLTTMIFPVVKSILFLLLGFGGVLAFGYYMLIIKRRRKWHVNIWERKADGRLQMITKDVLIEKKFNKNKQVMYMFKRQRNETLPPPWECVYRVRGKEYCDYLRLREDYMPIKREVVGFEGLPNDKSIFQKFKAKINSIKGKTPREVDKELIYIPINQTMNVEIKFKPMDYDVNIMRINALDIRNKIYADKMDFLQKYGTFIAFGMIVVLIIVVLYMSYEYSGNVIQMAMGKASETLSVVESLADKMGGIAPNQ